MNHSRRGILIIAGVGVLLHLLLLLLVRPVEGGSVRRGSQPPITRYVAAGNDSGGENVARRLWSPVLFSLPSSDGFSGELSGHDVTTRRTTVPQRAQSEQFLSMGFGQSDGAGLAPEQLMVVSGPRALGVPSVEPPTEQLFSTGQRLLLDPELRSRLVGGIVLPSELNQPSAQAWTVRATLSVSEHGLVEHVFVDQPLESKPLNQQLVGLLYRLRFSPGAAVERKIEIYSPESRSEGASQ